MEQHQHLRVLQDSEETAKERAWRDAGSQSDRACGNDSQGIRLGFRYVALNDFIHPLHKLHLQDNIAVISSVGFEFLNSLWLDKAIDKCVLVEP